ncbi:Hsp20/alpha crystallin family protein [Leptolyngbya sp. 15MV]|nr:Hsp20/alpha crystallin family protein [Leptolyngbya sp. 15MV]
MRNILVRRDPLEVPAFGAFDRLFSTMLGAPLGSMAMDIEEGNLALDVSEDDKNVIVRASLPGFQKDEIEVEVHEGVLTIKAEHAEEREEKGETFYRRERRVGAVSRRVALPSVQLEGEPTAELKDGVLTLRIPKSAKATPKRVKIS